MDIYGTGEIWIVFNKKLSCDRKIHIYIGLSWRELLGLIERQIGMRWLRTLQTCIFLNCAEGFLNCADGFLNWGKGFLDWSYGISWKDTDLSHWWSSHISRPNFVAGFLEFPDSLISQTRRWVFAGFTATSARNWFLLLLHLASNSSYFSLSKWISLLMSDEIYQSLIVDVML